jgi:hypothetical protein
MANERRRFALMFIGLMLACSTVARPQETSMSMQTMVSSSLACLVRELKPIGAAPPSFSHDRYKVQALFGEYSQDDRPNELHMLVWGPQQLSAVLYEQDISSVDGRRRIVIGQWATFTSRNGRLIPDELPGGLGTHQRILEMVKRLRNEHDLFIDAGDLDEKRSECVWKP